ncbi:MAG TPA: OmpA family protein, partial [Bacteroidia bacterium]
IAKEPELVENDFFSNPKAGQSIILRNVQFETAKWNLLPESYETLDSLVDLMARFPEMVIEIVGHTDNKGKAADNIKLSQNRAAAVMMYLAESGIEADRMKAFGKGQEEPIDTNDNETGRANNRRVEFKIISL